MSTAATSRSTLQRSFLSGPAVDRVGKSAAPVPDRLLRPQVRLWNNKVVRLPQEMVHLLPRSLPRFAFLAHRAPNMVSTKKR